MTEPTLALQGAIVAALKGAAPVAAVLGDRIYDRVPTAATKPYVRVGEDQVVPDRAECFERSVEIYATLHVWSGAVGRPEAKLAVGAIVDALDGADLDLGADLNLVLIEHDSTRFVDGDDPLTTHGVVVFRALIDAA